MLLSTRTEILQGRLGGENAVRLLCENGFDAIDYSMFFMYREDCVLHQPDYATYVKNLREIAAWYGVVFNQAHAPYPYPPYPKGTLRYDQKMLDKTARSIEITALLGSKQIVVHPMWVVGSENLFEQNMEFFGALLPYAKAYDVKIAIENLCRWDEAENRSRGSVCGTEEEHIRFLEGLQSRYLTLCLDLGHCHLACGDVPGRIRALGGERITALHVHDNDGIHDTHMPPYFGTINWDSVTVALREIGYQGDFTFEADSYLKKLPESVLPDAVRMLSGIGRELIRKITE